MASPFKTFSEDEIWAINEALLQTNTKKATSLLIVMLNLQQKRKNALDKTPEMFVNCK